MDAALPFDRGDVNAMVGELFAGSRMLCHELGPRHATVRCEVEQSMLRPGGFISGPTQFAAIDAALWFVTFLGLGRIEPMAMTSELSIRFLRPAQGSHLYCRADLESVSRRSVVGTAHVWCDDRTDKITATGQGTYAIPLPR
jgi:acyl-coenzyme A thioesterase PaaI-like protein